MKIGITVFLTDYSISAAPLAKKIEEMGIKIERVLKTIKQIE